MSKQVQTFFTVTEVGKMLNLSRATIHRYIKDGILVAHKAGPYIRSPLRVPASSVSSFCNMYGVDGVVGVVGVVDGVSDEQP